MAAFEDSFGPDLDQFGGRRWTEWQNAVESEEREGSNNDPTPTSRQDKEVATLKREDVRLFGFCPAKDNFFVVVCEYCKLPFKPQTFHYHFEKHHHGKPYTKQPVAAKAVASASKQSHSPSLSIVNAEHSSHKHSAPGAVSLGDPGGTSNQKRLDKKKISVAITQALSKASVPKTAKLLSNMGSSHRNLTDPSTDIHHSKPLLQHHLPSRKNSSSSDSSTPTDRHGLPADKVLKHLPKKLHKHSSLLPKTNITKVESVKKVQSVNKSHASKHSHHGANKLAKTSKLTVPKGGSHFAKAESNANGRRLSDAQKLSNGPFVVLKNSISPSTERKTSVTKTLVPSTGELTTSTPFREYKHHHNPQLDIVKAIDRGGRGETEHAPVEKSPKLSSVQRPLKPNKNIPLKAREYDPNKHCGVWVAVDNMHCTRSLTCKSHNLSLKRQVEGRRKPFDELIVEQAKAKQRLKEQHAKQVMQPAHISTQPADGEQKTVPKSTSDHPVLSAKPMADLKSSTQSTGSAKTKNSILLFPRSAPPRHIDCWNESPFEEECHQTVDPDQLYLPHHPAPISVNRFGGWTMDRRYTCYNRKTHHQWRSLSVALRDGSPSRKTSKHQTSTGQNHLTSLAFTPIPSASLPERLKESRFAAGACPYESGAVAADSIARNFSGNYATTTPPSPLSRDRCLANRTLKKSSSVDHSSLVRRASTGSGRSKKMNRAGRHTIDSSAVLSSSHAVSHDVKQLTSADGNIPTSFTLSTTDLSVLLTKGHEENAVARETHDIESRTFHVSDVRRYSADGQFKLPDEIDASQRVLARKRSATKSRRNSTLVELIQKPPTNQNLVTNHTQLVDSSTSNAVEYKPPLVAKQEPSLLNGISSFPFASHAWQNNTTVSGAVEALLQQNPAATDATNIPVKLEPNIVQGSNFMETVSQNVNNSNSLNHANSHDNQLEIFVSAAEPPSASSTIDSLHSLLLGNSADDFSTGSGQLLAEAAAKTGLMDVDPTASSASVQHAANTVSNLCNLDYLQLPADLRPLLDPGGMSKVPTASNALTAAQDDAVLFSSDLTELWNP